MKGLFITILIPLLLVGCGAPTLQTEVAPAPFTAEEFAKVDGSTVTIPLTESLAEKLLAIENGAEVIKHNKTSQAIRNLIEGKAKIIFTTHPSEKEIAEAGDQGVEFEITPVVRDAFVFLVNDKNKVNSVSQQQLKDIYSGRITNWSAVGGENLSIMAFQRNEGSGSQSGMLTFMGDTKLAEVPTERYMAGMSGLVETIIAPDNGAASVGYSYYYYVNAMYIKDGVKLLAVDGVEPSSENIQSGAYPLAASYYAIIRKDAAKDSFARRLLNYVLSEDGQRVVTECGYVGL
ncbi:MAG: Phosphate-binding protein PstS 1 precursor [Firmicutes bacterium ADurb.Bin193]|nr:MAG: Phosphate-binding protein PstS 1 precursor [Firmicutes bacterium ADurb.Bin193]